MKKSVCLVLCLFMIVSLFAGCRPKPESELPPARDVDATTQKPENDPAEPLSFSLDALPEIGAFAPNEKAEYFFPDGPHDTFEARDDYGEVVPYCWKSEKYFAASWSYTDEETGEVYSGKTDKEEEEYFATYGFATADGKIITEGIYASVNLRQNLRGDCFYAAYREKTYDMYGKVDLIAADGSWYLHFDTEVDLDLMEYQARSDPPMFIVSGEKETALYDFRGEKVLDLTPFRDEHTINVHVSYADSEKLLVEHIDWEKDARAFTLYDYDGNKLGQLPSSVNWLSSVYENGVMIVDIGNDRVQLLDVYGNALSGPCYDLRYSIKDQCFFANPVGRNNEIVLLDGTGKEQKALQLSYNTVKGEDGYVWIFDEGEHTFYDIDGKPTVMDADGQEIVSAYDNLIDWTGDTATAYYYVETANGDLHMFDTDGNKIKTLQDVTFETYEDDEEDPEKYYHIEMENGVLTCQKKDSLELTQLSSGKTLTVPIKDGERYGWTTALNSRIVAVSYRADDGTYSYVDDVYDIETGEQLFTDAVYTDSFGQYALVATKSESYLFDEAATPLIRLQNDALV